MFYQFQTFIFVTAVDLQDFKLELLRLKPIEVPQPGPTPRAQWELLIWVHYLVDRQRNKPIQDGGEAKAPLWLNRLSGTN